MYEWSHERYLEIRIYGLESCRRGPKYDYSNQSLINDAENGDFLMGSAVNVPLTTK